MNLYHPRLSALVWLAGMLLLGWLGVQQLKRDWLETSFSAMLPAAEYDQAAADAIQRNTQALNRKVLCLIGAGGVKSAITLAEQLKQQLNASGLFSRIVLQQPADAYPQNYQHLFRYRYQLLDERTRQQLQTDPAQVQRENLALLTSPFGQFYSPNLQHDPLLLFSRYFRTQHPQQFNLEDNVVVVQDGKRYWALLIAELGHQDLQLDKLEALLNLIEHGRAGIVAQKGELLVTGMPLFTAYGSKSAQQEMSVIGVGSSIGVAALLIFAFRSLRPLLLCCLAVIGGLFAAWVLSLQVFAKLHILTLVFGSSLIGVVVDYALHFFCDGIGLAHWTPRQGLRYVLPGLAFGLFTSLLGYAGLGFSPFPVLQQIALFSAFGLTTSWLTVVCLFPLLLTGFCPRPQAGMQALIRYWFLDWPRWLLKHKLAVGTVLSGFIIAGLLQLTARDNVRLLQSAPAALLSADARIRQLLPMARDNQFFLVAGGDLNDWYRNERQLLSELEKLRQTGAFKSYEAIGLHWQDPATQAGNYSLLQAGVYRPDNLRQTMADLGFSKAAIAEEQTQFAAAAKRVLSLDDWLTASDERRQGLWLGCEAGVCRSMVTLSGIADTATLAALQTLAHVTWVDPVERLSKVFQRYRINVSLLLFAVCALLSGLLIVRRGRRYGLQVMTVPVLSILLALAVLGWLGELFTLFNVFALLLVLEMAVDYAVFFRMAADDAEPGKRGNTAAAVTLSALTTLLAYGLLASSQTAIIHAFGVTLAAGVFAAFLFAPLSSGATRTER